MFPSPIGELHFSISELAALNSKGVNIEVSVPYRGATFLNSMNFTAVSEGARFPSPIGELHFSIIHNGLIIDEGIAVSVPYRGATFLN